MPRTSSMSSCIQLPIRGHSYLQYGRFGKVVAVVKCPLGVFGSPIACDEHTDIGRNIHIIRDLWIDEDIIYGCVRQVSADVFPCAVGVAALEDMPSVESLYSKVYLLSICRTYRNSRKRAGFWQLTPGDLLPVPTRVCGVGIPVDPYLPIRRRSVNHVASPGCGGKCLNVVIIAAIRQVPTDWNPPLPGEGRIRRASPCSKRPED